MNIQQTQQTVVEFTFTLSEAEAREVLRDPRALQLELRRLLRLKPGVLTEKRRPKDTAAVQKKKSRLKLTCPQCQRKFTTQGWLEKHIQLVHASDAENVQ